MIIDIWVHELYHYIETFQNDYVFIYDFFIWTISSIQKVTDTGAAMLSSVASNCQLQVHFNNQHPLPVLSLTHVSSAHQ